MLNEALFTAIVVGISLLSAIILIYFMSCFKEQNKVFKNKCLEKNGITYNVKGKNLCMKQDSVIIIP